MQRLLLVKTSSLGDVVHNLPVASDIASAFPGAAIDWVVEESIAALPALHASVRQTIPVAVRRWRKSAWRRGTWREIGSFIERLRAERYDAVIDSQGLFKSALITRAARGRRYVWAGERHASRSFRFTTTLFMCRAVSTRSTATGALRPTHWGIANRAQSSTESKHP